jgi:hypothetical protein
VASNRNKRERSRQARKEVRKLAFQPKIKAAKATAFEREQGANRDQFTGIERAAGLFFDPFHAVIHMTKQMCNNVFSFHWSLLGCWNLLSNLTGKALFFKSA